MFKLTKLFLILFIFFISAFSVKAFEFTKSLSNPLPITYIQDYVYNFQAHIYKEGNLYKGIIPAKKINQNNNSLVAIESANGINWQMTKEILINQGKDISNPRLVIDKEGNKKLFFVQTDGIELYRIYSVDCDNDLNCSSTINFVLGPDTNNYSENHGYFAPFVLNIDKYYLFYGVWGNNGFKIRLAYSETLSNWQKCPNDLISYGADGPFPYIENNDLYLFYHESDSSGIKLAKTTLPLSCSSVFEDLGYQISPSSSYDIHHMIYPSIIKEDKGLMIYYTGLTSNYAWSLNVACTGQICQIPTPTLIPTLTPALTAVPTSTPIPTPTSLPTPTVTPIPTVFLKKSPIILIPGLLASWNKEAILHNVSQPQSNWQMNPIVNDYKGIINTLKNLNYKENSDLFIFNYDWRKSILNTADELNNFINEKIGNKKFYIIGHSLGGLVGRIYGQRYRNTNLEKLITVGSPHQGASQTYNIVEAGEIERSNDYLWLAVKMITNINKNNFETDKQTINRLFPVIKDLFPVYNFLKKNGSEINIDNMKIKNTLLPYYNSNLASLVNLRTVVGEKGSTLKGFNVENQTFFDKLFDNYPDGRPQSSYKEIGDYLILSSSATVNTPEILSYDHGEIIYKKEAIKKILDLINIQYSDSQVIEGSGTIIDSSLIFLIKSPATIEVLFNGQIYSEHEGIIFIENAASGNYQLRVKGINKGNYEVVIGQIGQKNDIWENVYGETSLGKIDTYEIAYKSDFPKNIIVNDLLSYLKINNYQYKNLKNLDQLYISMIKKRDFIGLKKLENYELSLYQKNKRMMRSEDIRREINNIKKKFNELKKPINQVVLEQVINRMVIVEKEFINKNYSYCQILLETIEKLLKVVKI